jgi:hypothetical protein
MANKKKQLKAKASKNNDRSTILKSGHMNKIEKH